MTRYTRRADLLRGALAAAAFIGLAACGASAKNQAQQLSKPVYSWSWTKGQCGGERALDGDGVLWSQEGCDNPLVRGAKASLEQRAAIVGAFTRLPEPSASRCEVPAHQFQIDAGGRVRTWDICDAIPPGSLPDPFVAVPRAFTGGSTP